MEISAECPQCHRRVEVPLEGPSLSPGPLHCGGPLLPEATDRFLRDQTLNQCPRCGAPHLYRQKDFNRRLGVALVVVGVALAYFTYGLSLLLVTLIDWWLCRRVGEVGCCYGCSTQFRGKGVESLEPFQLELHDFYRSKRSD